MSNKCRRTYTEKDATEILPFIAPVAALWLFLPVTLRLAITQVEQLPTCEHNIWEILFIGKQCGDLRIDKLKCYTL